MPANPQRSYVIVGGAPLGYAEMTLVVQLTDEGVIADVMDTKGEVVATWGATAVEIAEELCH